MRSQKKIRYSCSVLVLDRTKNIESFSGYYRVLESESRYRGLDDSNFAIAKAHLVVAKWRLRSVIFWTRQLADQHLLPVRHLPLIQQHSSWIRGHRYLRRSRPTSLSGIVRTFCDIRKTR